MSEARELAIYYIKNNDPRIYDLINGSYLNVLDWSDVLSETISFINKDLFEDIIYNTDLDIYPDIMGHIFNTAVANGRYDLLASFTGYF